MFGANLVIPAQICDELSCGQGKVYGQTNGWTGQTQVTAIPIQPEMPRGNKTKKQIYLESHHLFMHAQ